MLTRTITRISHVRSHSPYDRQSVAFKNCIFYSMMNHQRYQYHPSSKYNHVTSFFLNESQNNGIHYHFYHDFSRGYRYRWTSSLHLNQKKSFHSSTECFDKSNIGKAPIASTIESASEKANHILQHLKGKGLVVNGEHKILDAGNPNKHKLTVQEINRCIVDLSKTVMKPNYKVKRKDHCTSTPNPRNLEIAFLAQNILFEMERLTPFIHNNNNNNNNNINTPNTESNLFVYQPDIYTYNAVLNTWAKSGGGRLAAQNAEQILEGMLSRITTYMEYRQHLSQQPNKRIDSKTSYIPFRSSPPLPTTVSFHSVMNAWAKSMSHDSGKKAEEMFQRMVQCHEDFKKYKHIKNNKRNHHDREFNFNVDVVPNVRSFAIMLDAWANTETSDAAERASQILDEMILRSTQQQQQQQKSYDNDLVIAPNSIACNSVIKAWAKSGRGAYGARKAEELLNKMEHSMIHFGNGTKSHMHGTYESEQTNLYSPSNTYDSYQYASPTVHSYSLVLDAWAKSKVKGSTLKAENILNRMHKLYNEGFDVKPNQYSFTIVINALAQSNEQGAAQRAEAILDRMIALYESDATDVDLKPSTTTFNATINAWSRSGDKEAGKRAECILNRLEKLTQRIPDFTLDRTTFNSTITAWARCSKYDERAVSCAEALLSRMKMYSNYETTKGSHPFSPDTVTYNGLLYAYRQSKYKSYVKNAEYILNQMEEDYKNGNNNVKPNLITYTSMIDVYAQSSTPHMAKNAEQILNRMIYLGNSETTDDARSVKPDLRTYSSLFQACANTKGDSKEKYAALQIALRAYDRLLNSAKHNRKLYPNNITYRILFEVCGFLTNNKTEREELLEKVFLQCCRDGQLDGNALKMFHRAATSDLYERLIAKNTNRKDQKRVALYKIHDLPSDWSSRVRYNNRE